MYIMKSLTEYDFETGERLYWNNQFGWGSKEEATQFTKEEIEHFSLLWASIWVEVSSKQ